MKHRRYRRILLITLLVIGAAALIGLLTRQKPYTIALVNPGTNQVYLDGFKDGMREYGYQTGQDVVYVEHLGVPIAELEPLLRDLVDQPVDLIFAIGTPTAVRAKALVAGTEIPVVFAAVSDPLSSGLVDNSARPGGNLTGVRSGGQMPKTLEWLLAIAPRVTTIWVPYNPKDGGLVQGYADLLQAAQARGVTLVKAEMTTPEELSDAIRRMPEEMDAIFHLPSSFLNPNIAEFIDLALARKIPLASGIGIFYEQGALLSFGSDGYHMSRQASRLAHQVLQGSSPGELPVETAEFFLGLNLQTAQALEITIPDDILAQAAHIIR